MVPGGRDVVPHKDSPSPVPASVPISGSRTLDSGFRLRVPGIGAGSTVISCACYCSDELEGCILPMCTARYSLVPRPHPLAREKDLVNLGKSLVHAQEFVRSNQITALV